MTTATAPQNQEWLTISEMSGVTGLTHDTLRWYEREGLFPPVARGSDRRRRYSPAHVGVLQVLVRLRRTGMPTRQVREFSQLMAAGAATHGARRGLLSAHREEVVRRIEQLTEDLAVLDQKVAHYQQLIDAGLDCDGAPVPAEVRSLQRHTGRPMPVEAGR